MTQSGENDWIKAEALEETANVLNDPRTLPDLDHTTVASVVYWLRDRATDLRLPPERSQS